MKKTEQFLTRFMNGLATFLGKPQVFLISSVLILAWLGTRFFLPYDTWYDVIDMIIFISTFLLLFVVQSSQNADTKAMQDKLDEIINSLPRANKQKEEEEKRLKRGEKK